MPTPMRSQHGKKLRRRQPDSDAIAAWKEVTSAAARLGLDRVLVNMKLSGPLSTWQAFNIGEGLEQVAWSRTAKLAFVTQETKFIQQLEFAQTVAENRGFTVQIFSSPEDAREWLLD